MNKIEAIGIFDSRTQSKDTILKYCKTHNIKIDYEEYYSDVNIFTYLNILFKKINNKLKNSNIEYLIIFGPYLSINWENINPKLFTSNNFDLFFLDSIKNQESWSFFVIKNSENMILSMEKLINIDIKDFNHLQYDSFYKQHVESTIFLSKSIFSYFNLKIIDDMVPNGMTTFLSEKDLFKSLTTSFFNDNLPFKSKMSNLDMSEIVDVNIVNNKLHYFNDICIVSFYTSDNINYAKYSLNSIKQYCDLNLISYNFFQESLIPNYPINLSKASIITRMFYAYDTVIWIDPNCMITNYNFNLRDFCRNTNKDFVAFKRDDETFDFNTNFMIFNRSDFSRRLLTKVTSEVVKINNKIFNEKILYSLDHNLFCSSVSEIDPLKEGCSTPVLKHMNSHPILWDEENFILNASGYDSKYMEKYFAYLYQLNR